MASLRKRRVEEREVGTASPQTRHAEKRLGRTVKSRKQAIAIGLNEAREKGAKVPSLRRGRKKTARKRSTSRRSARN